MPTPAPVRKRIGEILIERGKLDAAGLDRALRLQEETHETLGALLVDVARSAGQLNGVERTLRVAWGTTTLVVSSNDFAAG